MLSNGSELAPFERLDNVESYTAVDLHGKGSSLFRQLILPKLTKGYWMECGLDGTGWPTAG